MFVTHKLLYLDRSPSDFAIAYKYDVVCKIYVSYIAIYCIHSKRGANVIVKVLFRFEFKTNKLSDGDSFFQLAFL